MKPLNIIFAGTPGFGLPCLEAIHASPHNIISIYTQPDRPSGRGRKLTASPVKQWALKHQIQVAQPKNFKEPNSVEELASLDPDVMIVIAYGLILPQSVLNIPNYGCINVHASLLPRWRGASPIQQAILHGDKKSGITIMKMDKGLDTGVMLNKKEYPLSTTETAGSLHNQLSELAAEPLIETLNNLPNYLENAESQDDRLATYAPKIKKEDAQINWSESADIIDRKIRAYHPWPVAYSSTQGETMRMHKAHIIEHTSKQSPGTVVEISRNNIIVAAGTHLIAIEQIQFPGGKPISVSQWNNSNRQQIKVNTILK